MTDPDPNPDLEVLLKWDGVGLPPKRPAEPQIPAVEIEIENAENEDDVAHEDQNPKSQKSSPPAGDGNVGDSAS